MFPRHHTFGALYRFQINSMDMCKPLGVADGLVQLACPNVEESKEEASSQQQLTTPVSSDRDIINFFNTQDPRMNPLDNSCLRLTVLRQKILRHLLVVVQ